jgi:hypothetical protein
VKFSHKELTIQQQMENWLISAIKEFKLNNNVKTHDRCEMRSEGITLLMRCQTNHIDELCLVIAAVRLEKSLQSQGWLKSFLSYCIEINPWKLLVIEDVDNLRLREFCKKSGFKPVSDFFSTSFIIDPDFIKSLQVHEFCS